MKSICENFRELPQMSELRRNVKEQLNRVIEIMLLELAKEVHVSRKYSAEKVPALASCIIADFWDLRLEDVHLALRKIATGKFKLFDRLDMPVLYECLNEWRDEKSVLFEAMRESKHLQDKASSGAAERSQITIREYWRKLTKKEESRE